MVITKMTDKHTNGPWAAIRGIDQDDSHRCGITVRHGELDYLVAIIENGAPGDSCDTEFANAARIVACVNALEGIDDPAAFMAEVRDGMVEPVNFGKILALFGKINVHLKEVNHD